MTRQMARLDLMTWYDFIANARVIIVSPRLSDPNPNPRAGGSELWLGAAWSMMPGRVSKGTETRRLATRILQASYNCPAESRTFIFISTIPPSHPAMHSSIWYHLLAFGLPLGLVVAASDDSKGKKEPVHAPCTIRSPTSGAFFDLNPIHVILPDDPKKAGKDARNESWSARGYDYGTNFTLNFCGPVVENLTNVVGVDEARWQNVSAFYQLDGKTYSIG